MNIMHKVRANRNRKTANLNHVPLLKFSDIFELKEPRNCIKAYHEALHINFLKKQDLLKLCRKNIILEEVHPWYQTLLTTTDVLERVIEPAKDDVKEEVEVNGKPDCKFNFVCFFKLAKIFNVFPHCSKIQILVVVVCSRINH